MYIREQSQLGDIPVPGVSALTNLIGPLAILFGGKPSNFTAWAAFDQQAHPIGVLGDKPNSNTSGMAQAISQGIAQIVTQIESQGGRFNVPSHWAVDIGQRDPSSIYMPLTSTNHINVSKGAVKVADIAGPGDVNGAMNGALNWLKQYMTGNSAVTSVQSQIAPGGSPPGGIPSQQFSPLTQLQSPQTIPSPSFGIPQTSAGGFSQGNMVDFSTVLPYLGAAAGFVLLMTMIQNKPQPTRLRKRSGAVKSTIRRSARRATRR